MPRWLLNLILLLTTGVLLAAGLAQLRLVGELRQETAGAETNVGVEAPVLISFVDWLAERPVVPLKKEISLLMVGDIMLSRTVGERMLEQGYDFPFAKVKNLVAEADYAVANLECPVMEGDAVAPLAMVFRADPAAVAALARAGFDAANLANNHFMNQGETGARKTFAYLRENNIAWFGALESTAAASNVLLVREINGLRLGFLGYAYGPKGDAAGASRPGIVLMDREKLAADVAAARQHADFLVVSMHDGIEYCAVSSDSQQAFARAAIDAGADLVVGHHPHVIQEIEKYRGKYIFYSLGNFIFDQEWSIPTKQGLAAKFIINEQGLQSYELLPVLIEDYAQPRFAEGAERDAILEKIKTVN